MSDIVKRLRSSDVFNAPMNINDTMISPVALMAADEIVRLRKNNDELEKALLPWIEQVGFLNAHCDGLEATLRRIGMPGKDIGYCRDGHEIAVLIARDALGEDPKPVPKPEPSSLTCNGSLSCCQGPCKARW
jgi:hypothetical protein